MTSPRFLAAGMAFIACAAACRAAITVTGVTDRSYHTDSVTFTVAPEAGATFVTTVDGQVVGGAGTFTESRFGYHELRVEKTPAGGGAVETARVRFIVKDSYRGGSSNTYPEAGLPRWTPRRSVDAPAAVLDAAALSVVAPPRVPAGFPLPVVARLVHESGEAARVMGTARLDGGETFRLFRGAGSVVTTAPAAGGPLRLRLGSRTVEKPVAVEAAPNWQPVSGALSTRTFAAGSFVDVTGTVSVAAGQVVTFEAGCVVRCAKNVEWDVRGTLVLAGTAAEPVVFGPAAGAVWGGVWIHGNAARIEARHALFTGGGANPDWIDEHGMHAHRSEQPILTWSDGASGFLEDSAIVDNPSSQCLHGEDATFTIRRCLLQKAITGGQIHNCTLTWEGNHLVEIPVDDTFVDSVTAGADHDGLYCDGGVTVIRDSVFGWCKDDAVDAGSGNTSNVTVTGCWFESALHEGMAWSEGGTRTVRDTVVMNSGQGLECGFTGQGSGSPRVDALRVFATGNAVGIRYGDNYDWDYSGRFDVHDSASIFNGDDVFGIHWGKFVGGSTKDWAYVGNNRSSSAYMHLEAVPAENLAATIVSVPQAEHPTLPVWDGSDAAHVALIAPLLSFPELASGAGLVDEGRQHARASYGGSVEVRLDRPVTLERSVPWRLLGKADASAVGEVELATGVLVFPAGRESAPLVLPQLGAGADAHAFLALVLTGGEGVEITGHAAATWFDAGFPEPPPPPAATTLVARSTAGWKYLAQGSAAPADWPAPGFDDTGWTSATAPFHTAESSVGGTAVPGNASNGNLPHNTVYFRRAFTVDDPAPFATLTVQCMRPHQRPGSEARQHAVRRRGPQHGGLLHHQWLRRSRVAHVERAAGRGPRGGEQRAHCGGASGVHFRHAAAHGQLGHAAESRAPRSAGRSSRAGELGSHPARWRAARAVGRSRCGAGNERGSPRLVAARAQRGVARGAEAGGGADVLPPAPLSRGKKGRLSRFAACRNVH